MGPALALAMELIGEPSAEACLRKIAERLGSAGFACEFVERGGVLNLWARKGSEGPVACLAGHADTVPAGPADRWASDPFTPEIRGGMLVGRGAADMKGALAALAVAAEDFDPADRGSVAFLATCDEEGPAVDGTAAVVDLLSARGEKIDFCLVGEPASERRLGDAVKVGRRGSLSGRAKIKGVQGHVAYPDLAVNPIHKAAPALAELAATVWDEVAEGFPCTSWQASGFRAGNGAGNVVPGEAELDFNFRFAPSSPPERLRRRFEEILRRHGVEAEVEWTLGAEPYSTRPGPAVEAAKAALMEELGVSARESTAGGTSDGRFLAKICPQVVEVGLVGETIHQANERVRAEDVDRIRAVYGRWLDKVLPRRI